MKEEPEEPSSSCSRALLKIARVRSRGGWRDNATFKRPGSTEQKSKKGSQDFKILSSTHPSSLFFTFRSSHHYRTVRIHCLSSWRINQTTSTELNFITLETIQSNPIHLLKMSSSEKGKDLDTRTLTDDQLAMKAQDELALEGDMEEVS